MERGRDRGADAKALRQGTGDRGCGQRLGPLRRHHDDAGLVADGEAVATERPLRTARGAALDGDPATSWVSDPSNPVPTVTLRWDEPRTLDEVRIVDTGPPTEQAARLRLESPAGDREVVIGGAGGGTSRVTVIAGAGGGLRTTISGGGTNEGGGGANFGGGGRFSGGGGGGGLTSSMILVSIGALMTSTTLRARPLTSAQPISRCISTTIPKPIACLPGLPCCSA